ncbi:Histidine triad nucleotide-binding protein 2, mitochondrial [Perkinsus olseni]|uniref:Histidine triad nucleotide-binding protein 2, mitochondrial n=1 Tax=Perkinsus olseni TaxID=32597 RepID=A0A7J6PH98_PEROL|nr:Histidine triad nucleotide-binding protein 2, mitochondrial [Perkinsus olseni]
MLLVSSATASGSLRAGLRVFLPQPFISAKLKHMSTAEGPPTIFDKILSGEVPSKKVYEDDLVYAFRDVNPVAPVHVLLIPKHKGRLTRLSKATEKDKDLLGHMMVTVPKVASAAGLDEYRLVINDGASACQSVPSINPHPDMNGNEEDDGWTGEDISEKKYHFYPYGRGSCDWTLEEHDRIRKKSMDEIESHFNPSTTTTTPVTPSTSDTAAAPPTGQKMDSTAGANPFAKKPGTIGSKFSTAHNTYFLDEDLDMGPDIENLGSVPGSGIHETTEKDESGYHYYDPLSGQAKPASGVTDSAETWQWGKVDNVLKHSSRQRTHSGSYKSSSYDANIPLAAARFEDSGDFDRNMFSKVLEDSAVTPDDSGALHLRLMAASYEDQSEEAPKEWMAAADDGDVFAFQGKEVKAGSK